MYGKGLFSNPSVNYVGDFVCDKRHGWGVRNDIDGSLYVGHFSLNLKQGQGVCLTPKGTYYVGNFYND